MRNTKNKLKQLRTLTLGVILILSFSSFTASSQRTDSLYCFTQSEVKEFLRTKVDLEQCLETSLRLNKELEEKSEENNLLTTENERVRVQRNRSRWIAVGTGTVGILSTILLILK